MNDPDTLVPIDLDEIVEAFESSLVESGEAQIERFLPNPQSREYREILAELIRVDLEHRWTRGERARLDEYRSRFPETFLEPAFVAPLAFEEFRVRRHAGEPVGRNEYAARYQIDVRDWPDDLRPRDEEEEPPAGLGTGDSFPAAQDETRDPPTADRPGGGQETDASPSPAPPLDPSRLRPGQRFLGFEIVGELGRGAAATVYLARQRLLANRHVVLKVTPEPTIEADRLARLQHTNIVPIYSFHQVGPLHVLCMPFLGSCVLNQWVDHLRSRAGVPVTSDEFLTTLERLQGTTLGTRESVPAVPRSPSGAPLSAPPPATGMHRLRGVDYQETVLWLAVRLAEGLAHAHDQGILHLDIKPGNILLTDDGQPMLLDFHLATVSASHSPGVTAVGGTLPYMSPEQLRSLDLGGTVDVRSDVYSLGVVLFELLTGQLPFPRRTGPLTQVLVDMQDDRRQPPRVRSLNPVVTPAVDSIVGRCLAPDPAHRYRSAHELSEDIHRHLKHLPLQFAPNPSVRERITKWLRRHPRLTSAGSMLLVSLAIVTAMGVGWSVRERHLARLEAEQRLSDFSRTAPLVKSALSLPTTEPHELRPELERAWQLLATAGLSRERIEQSLKDPSNGDSLLADWRSQNPYRLLSAPAREQLDQDVGQMLFLLAAAQERPQADSDDREQRLARALACNRLAQDCFPHDDIPSAVWLQRADLFHQLGRSAEAEEARVRGEQGTPDSALDRQLSALRLVTRADFGPALELLKSLRDADPGDPGLWFLSGDSQLAMHDYGAADGSYTACIALRPDWILAWYQRGVGRLQARRFAEAADDFSHVLSLDSRHSASLVSRALAFEGAGRYAEAVTDLTAALEAGFPETRIYFLRARIRDRIGQSAEAAADRAEGFRKNPTDARSWVARGMARLSAEPERALEDFESAVALNPHEYEAYRSIAHVLSERLNRTEEAIAALDTEIQLTTSDPLAYAGRGVLQARRGNRKLAEDDARLALAGRREPLVVYQAACIEALGSSQSPDGVTRALALLGEALRGDQSLALIAPIDPDLVALRELPDFQNLVSAASLLQRIVPLSIR